MPAIIRKPQAWLTNMDRHRKKILEIFCRNLRTQADVVTAPMKLCVGWCAGADSL